FAVFNDAGGAVSRLPALEARGIPAAAVDCMSACIGDARSAWESGVLSYANAAALALGVAPGMAARKAVAVVAAAQKRA
ncbi:MAG TPA: hypothetical protein VFX09_08000, partial [Burkholderiales bacterium]|nr:hypothetical protein [Burkholderiales bacterium]